MSCLQSKSAKVSSIEAWCRHISAFSILYRKKIIKKIPVGAADGDMFFYPLFIVFDLQRKEVKGNYPRRYAQIIKKFIKQSPHGGVAVFVVFACSFSRKDISMPAKKDEKQEEEISRCCGRLSVRAFIGAHPRRFAFSRRFGPFCRACLWAACFPFRSFRMSDRALPPRRKGCDCRGRGAGR